MNGFPYLTLLVLTPAIGALLVAAVPRERAALARGIGLLFSGLGLATLFLAMSVFDPGSGAIQLEERHAWIPALGVDYRLGVDGLGLMMLMLSGLLVPFAQVVAWPLRDRVPLFNALVLALQAGLFGTFTALNFFHWFIFWELSLIPAFFLIKIWGGPSRSSAATQFFVYTMAGSVALLLAFLALLAATRTLDFTELAGWAAAGRLESAVAGSLSWGGLSPAAMMNLLFFGALLAFAVKVPLMPFHTWLPATYAEAPSAVTMLLTGAMSKMGVYGLLRLVVPIFPEQLRQWQMPLVVLAVVTVVGGAAAAMAQRDLKRMFAYSSVNHLGYCLLAIFAAAPGLGGGQGSPDQMAAMSGTVLQMFNHGLTAATLFAFVAFLERRVADRRGIDDFGGLRQVVPVWTGLMGVAVFSSLGLPGLNGFVGEFLIFKGVFGLVPWAAVFSGVGLLLTAVFLLTFIQKVFWGPLREERRGFAELSLGERWTVGPALALMLILGVAPQVAVLWYNRTIVAWVEGLTR